MKSEEIEFVETEVKQNLTPDIKAALPPILGWILKAIFPKLEVKIIDFIIALFEKLLEKREQ